MVAWDDMAVVGRVTRPHGLRGDVVIKPETDFVAERFRPGATLWTRSAGRDEQLTIASARVHNGRPVHFRELWMDDRANMLRLPGIVACSANRATLATLCQLARDWNPQRYED